MILEDGYYRPGPHIAQELLHFPNEHLTKKQIQQFLGIINYLRDFLPQVSIQASAVQHLKLIA